MCPASGRSITQMSKCSTLPPHKPWDRKPRKIRVKMSIKTSVIWVFIHRDWHRVHRGDFHKYFGYSTVPILRWYCCKILKTFIFYVTSTNFESQGTTVSCGEEEQTWRQCKCSFEQVVNTFTNWRFNNKDPLNCPHRSKCMSHCPNFMWRVLYQCIMYLLSIPNITKHGWHVWRGGARCCSSL